MPAPGIVSFVFSSSQNEVRTQGPHGFCSAKMSSTHLLQTALFALAFVLSSMPELMPIPNNAPHSLVFERRALAKVIIA